MKKIIYFLIITLSSITCLFAQNTYQFSTGISLPDNVSNKYFKPGFYLSYGVDFKLSDNFSIKPDISITFINRNKNYKFGFEDEPRFQNNPVAVEAYERMISNSDEDYYSTYQFYLFNPSIGINLKYVPFPKKMLSPYIFAGLSGNYSFSIEAIDSFMFDNNVEFTGIVGVGSEPKQKFNITYRAGLGLKLFFRNRKALFIETQYRYQPAIKFGRNSDRVGMFILNFGISSPFTKKEKDNVEEDSE